MRRLLSYAFACCGHGESPADVDSAFFPRRAKMASRRAPPIDALEIRGAIHGFVDTADFTSGFSIVLFRVECPSARLRRLTVVEITSFPSSSALRTTNTTCRPATTRCRCLLTVGRSRGRPDGPPGPRRPGHLRRRDALEHPIVSLPIEPSSRDPSFRSASRVRAYQREPRPVRRRLAPSSAVVRLAASRLALTTSPIGRRHVPTPRCSVTQLFAFGADLK